MRKNRMRKSEHEAKGRSKFIPTSNTSAELGEGIANPMQQEMSRHPESLHILKKTSDHMHVFSFLREKCTCKQSITGCHCYMKLVRCVDTSRHDPTFP